jgi:hypothetical protein
MNKKPEILGIIVGLILPIAGALLAFKIMYPELNETMIYKKLWGGIKFSGSMRAGVLLNVLVFFISIYAFNKERFAKGILISTFIVALFAVYLYLMS